MANRTSGTAIRILVITCTLWATPYVHSQPLSATDRFATASAARDSGNYRECLTQLQQGALTSERLRWLRIECLHDGFRQAPEDRQRAVELLVSCSEFVRKNDASKKIATAITFLKEIKAYFGDDGFGFHRLQHVELPPEQRAALMELETLLADYTQANRRDPAMEKEMDVLLDQLADMDLPMPGGETPITYCLKRDGLYPTIVLLAHARELKGGGNFASQLLDMAVRHDARQIVNHLLNGEVGTPNEDTERDLMQLAVNHQSSRVLYQWFLAPNDPGLVALNAWSIYAPRHATALAKAAIVVNDTTFLREALLLGVQPDSLGRMVFRTMEASNWDVLDVLLSAAPPEHAKDIGGMSYLHKAFILDSPEALKSLADHGWLERLAGEQDDEGSPAAHYLATMDLQRILENPAALADLNMNATDRNGYTLLHKLVFRSPELSIPSNNILTILLNSVPNPKRLSKNTIGPLHDWTPLHYAAREDQPELVRILVKKGADKHAKDTWGRSPKDVAREYGYKEVIKAM